MRFTEIADRVHVLAHPEFGVNCTLIVGDGAALLIDTLSTEEQGAQLSQEIRRITPHPLTIVNTHFHFDHCFGNNALAGEGTEIWGHPDCAQELRERGKHWRLVWEKQYELDLSGVHIRPPDHLVNREQSLHIGSRRVVLSHHGRGHTSGDLVARVDDVLITGDLVEQGAPPDFGDSYPLEWPEVLAALIELTGPQTVVVPGHGSLVDHDFIKAEHDELTRLDWLIRDGHADNAPLERVVSASPLNRWGEPGQVQSRLAVKRGFAQLAGSL